MTQSLDVERLERAVKSVYRDVAEAPDEEYHFEMGRGLAERLGYPPEDLDQIPTQALESFAGVGYHFDYAAIEAGDDVLDLGSGSGTDVFVAALHVGSDGNGGRDGSNGSDESNGSDGSNGSVTGLDMTGHQLAKSRRLRDETGADIVSLEKGYIEDTPFEDASFDVVVSNGVINLSPEKQRVFEEAYRVLRPGGRLAVSDIISEKLMPESIKNNEDLWAACIGGAEQADRYTALIENAGFEVEELRENTDYQFISDQAASACQKYGVKSISLGARK